MPITTDFETNTANYPKPYSLKEILSFEDIGKLLHLKNKLPIEKPKATVHTNLFGRPSRQTPADYSKDITFHLHVGKSGEQSKTVTYKQELDNFINEKMITFSKAEKFVVYIYVVNHTGVEILSPLYAQIDVTRNKDEVRVEEEKKAAAEAKRIAEQKAKTEREARTKAEAKDQKETIKSLLTFIEKLEHKKKENKVFPILNDFIHINEEEKKELTNDIAKPFEALLDFDSNDDLNPIKELLDPLCSKDVDIDQFSHDFQEKIKILDNDLHNRKNYPRKNEDTYYRILNFLKNVKSNRNSFNENVRSKLSASVGLINDAIEADKKAKEKVNLAQIFTYSKTRLKLQLIDRTQFKKIQLLQRLENNIGTKNSNKINSIILTIEQFDKIDINKLDYNGGESRKAINKANDMHRDNLNLLKTKCDEIDNKLIRHIDDHAQEILAPHLNHHMILEVLKNEGENKTSLLTIIKQELPNIEPANYEQYITEQISLATKYFNEQVSPEVISGEKGKQKESKYDLTQPKKIEDAITELNTTMAAINLTITNIWKNFGPIKQKVDKVDARVFSNRVSINKGTATAPQRRREVDSVAEDVRSKDQKQFDFVNNFIKDDIFWSKQGFMTKGGAPTGIRKMLTIEKSMYSDNSFLHCINYKNANNYEKYNVFFLTFMKNIVIEREKVSKKTAFSFFNVNTRSKTTQAFYNAIKSSKTMEELANTLDAIKEKEESPEMRLTDAMIYRRSR